LRISFDRWSQFSQPGGGQRPARHATKLGGLNCAHHYQCASAITTFAGVGRLKQVYKVTYPNGKIYVGSDLTGTLTYFGSPSNQQIAVDLAAHRLDLTARKQILWESETASKAEVLEMERKFIQDTGANNPAIGYNLTPRWTE
jgi:hypothetical protein